MAVEYILHDYDLRNADLYSHVKRISQLVTNESRHLLNQEISFDTRQPPQYLLQSITNVLRSKGLDGVCVLIDNVASGPKNRTLFERWELIQQVAIRAIDLLAIDGLMVKFLFPVEFLELTHSVLPIEHCYEIRWRKDQLTEILRQRLLSCMDQQLKATDTLAGVAPIFRELFESNVVDRVAQDFIEFGAKLGQPYEMWRLGHYVLEGHFNQSKDRRRSIDALIRYETLNEALELFTKEEIRREPLSLPSSTPTISPLQEQSSPGRLEYIRIADALDSILDALDKPLSVEYPAGLTTTSIEDPPGDKQEVSQNVTVTKALEKLGATLDSLIQAIQEMSVPNSLSGLRVALPDGEDAEEINWKKAVEDALEQGYQYERACNLIKERDKKKGIMLLGRWSRIENDYTLGKITRIEYDARLSELGQNILTMLDKI